MVSQETYRELRARYRLQNLLRVRRRESLPEHDGERYLVGEGRVGLAVGKRKGVGAGLAMASAVAARSRVEEEAFDLFVADPFDLARELVDLERDATNFALSECIRHPDVEMGFDMHESVLVSEEALLEWTRAVNGE
jgi:hypothetical protein